LAVITEEAQVLTKMVVSLDGLNEMVATLVPEFQVQIILIGDRTNSKSIRESVTSFKLPIIAVNEDGSTVEGRYRYLKENTKGLAKLIPIGLRIPKNPFDDYVAVILAERYLGCNPVSSRRIIE
jgi:hypothetical protein